jgi:hypothetical protein
VALKTGTGTLVVAMEADVGVTIVIGETTDATMIGAMTGVEAMTIVIADAIRNLQSEKDSVLTRQERATGRNCMRTTYDATSLIRH